MSFFSVHNLSAGYSGAKVISGLSFSVQSGALVGVLGANGCGKTTLLKAICGILPHSGTCTLDGIGLDGLSARKNAQLVSYIPQRSGISIDVSALDVVLMGFNPQLRLLEHPTPAMRKAALNALARVGLAARSEDNYLHLSEGQKQLCILARTLVSSGKLLLLDEPESALDVRFRHQMLGTIRRWLGESERCAVVTLHDPALALNFCDELLLIEGGTCIGTLRPREDSLEAMANLLSRIYGAVSLTVCHDRTGKAHIVMLKEEENGR